MRKEILIAFLLLATFTAVYCRTLSAVPPKGTHAPHHDVDKPLDKGLRAAPTTQTAHHDETSSESSGRPEEKTRSAGGNKDPNFNENNLVGKGLRGNEDFGTDTPDHGSDLQSDSGGHITDDRLPPEHTHTRNLLGGNKAPGFDASKAVGRGARDLDGPDDHDSWHVVSDLPASDRPELKSRNIGGGQALDSDAQKQVARSVHTVSGRPVTDLPAEDGPEFEARNLGGGGQALDFDTEKHVGRGIHTVSGHPVTDSVDDIPAEDGPEFKSRNLGGGGQALDFDAQKLVGRGVQGHPVTDIVDDLPADDHPELKSRNLGGNVAQDFDVNKPVGRSPKVDGLLPDDWDPNFDDDDDGARSDGGPPKKEEEKTRSARSPPATWQKVI